VGCSSCGSVHDNEFYNLAEGLAGQTMGVHGHIIYENGPGSLDTYLAYNNAIHDSFAGLVISVHYDAAVFNNVIWNSSSNASIQLISYGSNDNSSRVGYVFNNTMFPGNAVFNVSCLRWDSGPTGLGTVYIQNNLCDPSSGGFGGVSVATQHVSNNYVISDSEAAQYGFTSARKYFPSSSDPNLAGKGANPMPSLPTSAPLASLAYDTQGAPWFGGSPVARTSWDLGAYVVGGQSSSKPPASKPNPPSNLAATVQ
jgi:hypothetical protein